MLEQILNQLTEYMKYHKMENSLIHDTFKGAFSTGDFKNVYLDKKTYPVLKEQMFKLMCKYEKEFPERYIKSMFW